MAVHEVAADGVAGHNLLIDKELIFECYPSPLKWAVDMDLKANDWMCLCLPKERAALPL